MLISMKHTLKEAREKGYCVPALGIGNEHNLRACLRAAEEKQSPVILLVMYGNHPDIEYFGRIATDLARRAAVPVSIILDHGAKYEHAVSAIRAGFTDVMIDCSSLPYAENAAQVKEVVKAAHAVGVGVEAELGHVGSGSAGTEMNGEGAGDSVFTVPAEAVNFAAETEIDALAVSVGTAHGAYRGTPKLQFDLLQELREKVPVPLVLHGGSGTGDENLAKACRMGICKLNIAYDLYRGGIDHLLAHDVSGNGAYGLYRLLGQGIQEAAEHAIEICGSAGRA